MKYVYDRRQPDQVQTCLDSRAKEGWKLINSWQIPGQAVTLLWEKSE